MSKGLSGELNTTARLTATLDESLYHYHHDIIVPFKNGSAQIDHLVVSPFGLFIIETKNLAGWIYGSSDKAKWTQVLFKTKHQFQNPLRQTFRQKKVIASYLRIREKDIHPIMKLQGVIEQAALDKYIFIRNAYLQRRAYLIKRNTELDDPYLENNNQPTTNKNGTLKHKKRPPLRPTPQQSA